MTAEMRGHTKQNIFRKHFLKLRQRLLLFIIFKETLLFKRFNPP